MKNVILFIVLLFLYQGVSALTESQYYVIEKEKNLCGIFTPGSQGEPNWLPHGWEAVFLSSSLGEDFISDSKCELGAVSSCCKNNGFKYAGIPIGQKTITEDRKSAEYIASKGIIQTRKFNPHVYNLDSYISRKEMMKIVMNISGKIPDQTCKGIFSDVENDWGCKYIESALKEGYITKNKNFRPNDSVTRTEAIKLIFKAKGIEKKYNTDNWEQDYISSAYYLGYIPDKFSNYTQNALRGWIFSITAKTFETFGEY